MRLRAGNDSMFEHIVKNAYFCEVRKMENCITNALGKPRHIKAYNTYQVKNYERFELAAFSDPAKRKWREERNKKK